jgi:hypothetical protein
MITPTSARPMPPMINPKISRLVVRIDDVGRAEAVQYDASRVSAPTTRPAVVPELKREVQMWRDIDPRAVERDRPEPGRGRVGGSTDVESFPVSDDPREVFTRELDLPRGSSRERVRANDREYRLSGDDVRVLATVGAFRVVPASDLREPSPRTPTRPARDLDRLRDLGFEHTLVSLERQIGDRALWLYQAVSPPSTG